MRAFPLHRNGQWFAGLQHGNALADVLYGVAEPGGRLPQTFPVDEKQASFPAAQYPGVGGTATYSDGLLVGYRAYDAAIKIAGPTAEILNNQGYSYMLRGDFQHARAKLVAAREKEPDNPYIKNNFELLEASVQRRKIAR